MTTTFAPEEGSVRNELTLFKGLFAISLIFGIALIVITLSLGYNVCTRDIQIIEENTNNKRWMEENRGHWKNTRSSPSLMGNRTEFERVSSF